MDFGDQPLANNFLKKDDYYNEYFFNMSIGFCEESSLVQLINQPPPEKMFHDQYSFYSGTSNYMKMHFKNFADEVIDSKYLSKNSPFVVELGCNDGIMLKNFADKKIAHLGIEPSLNVALEANKNGVQTISEFFSESVSDQIVSQYGQVDAFLAANVMCHISSILDVVRGIKKLLKPSGVVMFEEPYLGDIVVKNSYDQIYDEHVFLFSLHSVRYLFNLVDMELIDASRQSTHGGSMRYVLAHKDTYQTNENIENLMEEEKKQGLNQLITFDKFRKNVEKSRLDLLDLLTNLKSQGKVIAGYAATSKSTTILNYCGIGPDLISYICDTTPIKQGKVSPGMHIPIVPNQEFISNPPDYAFLFAWNHAEEIMAKEKDFVANGGKWITHIPKVQIL